MNRIFFNFLKNSQFAKFAKFRMRTQLFPRHALPKIFLLYTVITLVILNAEFGLIWTTPWPDKKDLFLKFLFREIQKVLYENPTFFLVKLNEKYILLYTVITIVILNAEFGLIWTTPWPDEEDQFLKLLFREFKKFYMKTQPFPSQAKRKILFALHCHYNGDTQNRVWFDLGNSLTRWKRIFF